MDYRQEKTALVTTMTDQATTQVELSRLLFAEKVHYEKYFGLWQDILRLMAVTRQHKHDSTPYKIREIAVLDKQGRVLGHSAPERNPLLKVYAGRDKLAITDTSPTQGLAMHWNSDQSRLSVTTALRWDNQPVGWLYVMYTAKNLQERLHALWVWHAVLVVLSGLLAFFLGAVFTRWVTQPLNSVIPVLGKIGEGGLSLPALHPRKDEFGTLARALETADRRISLAVGEQKQLMSILEATPDIVGMADTEERTIFLNAAGRKQLGYGLREDLSDHRVADDHSEKVARYLRQEVFPTALRDGEWRGETLFRRRDGSEFVTSQVIVAHTGEDGVVTRFSSIARDISREKAAEQELRNYQANLEQMVKIRTSELEAEKDKAEAASHAKSEFLSRMSHELRTPMNAVLGFAQLLELDPEEHLSAEEKESTQEILDAGQHLLTLINEVLDLARIDSGRMEISLEAVHLAEVVQASVKLVQVQAENHAVQIVNNIDAGGDMVVRADFTRLRQILVNLLGNAVKYNHAGGSVQLSCRIVKDNRCCVDITDTGKGIRNDDLDKLFQPFERLDVRHNVQGTGIGLAISLRLAKMMGGTLSVQSSYGEGSTFSVELPLYESFKEV